MVKASLYILMPVPCLRPNVVVLLLPSIIRAGVKTRKFPGSSVSSYLCSIYIYIYIYIYICMATYGYVGLCMAVYGYVGPCMAVYGSVWLCWAMYGYVGLCMVM